MQLTDPGAEKPLLQLAQFVHSFMGREQLNDPVRAWWAMHLMCIFSGSKLNKFMNPAWGMAGCLAWWCVGCRSRQKAALVETSGIPLLLRGWEGEAM